MKEYASRVDTSTLYHSARLTNALSAITTCPVTFIHAPMGYGKTMAVRSYLENCELHPLWVSVLTSDPATFWRDFCAVLRRNLNDDSPIPQEMEELGYPSNPAKIDMVRELVARLRFPAKTVLIFDDVHHLPEDEAAGFVRLCLLLARLGALPPLVFISRHSPSHEFAEPLLKRIATEIGPAPFALNAEEVREYFEQCGLPLDQDKAQELQQATGGWVSALYLALQKFTRSGKLSAQTEMSSLLASQVFDRLDNDAQKLLLLLSPLESFTKDQALLFCDCAEVVLDELCHRNAFINRDPASEVYTLHALFRSFLTEKFNRLPARQQQEAYQRNAQWLIQRDEVRKAVTLIGSFKDANEAIELLNTVVERLPVTEGNGLLMALFRSFPLSTLEQYPGMMFRYAMAALSARDIPTFGDILGRLGRYCASLPQDQAPDGTSPKKNSPGECSPKKTAPKETVPDEKQGRDRQEAQDTGSENKDDSEGAYPPQGDHALSAEEAKRPLLPPDANCWRGEMQLLLALTKYNDIEAMSVHHRRAGEFFDRSSDKTSRLFGQDPWTLGSPSVLYMFHKTSGELEHTLKQMRECLPHYTRLTNMHGSGAEDVIEAEALYNAGKFKAAAVAGYRALASAEEHGQIGIEVCARFLLARLDIHKGDYGRAMDQLTTMHAHVQEKKAFSLLQTVSLCSGFLHMIIRQPERIPDWLRQGGEERLYAFAGGSSNIVLGGSLLLAKEYAQVAGRFSQLLQQGLFAKNLMFTIYANIFVAAGNMGLGFWSKSDKALLAGLDLALPDDLYVPFVHFSHHLPQLKTLRDDPKYGGGIQRILEISTAFEKAHNKIVTKHFPGETLPLTPRERELVQLVLTGMTYKKIAEVTGLAPSSVKRYFARLFKKIGVSSRDQLKQLLATEKH